MLKTLTAYKRWANGELFDRLLQVHASAPIETAHGMLRLLNHVYVVDRIFQAHLLGQPHGYTALNTTHTPSLLELWQAVQLLDEWYVQYAAALSASAEQERLNFTYVDGKTACMSRAEMLLHVINHDTYHRGAVGELLHQCGLPVPHDVLSRFLN
jgi:uncharacterized damage-inducible protein DinB